MFQGWKDVKKEHVLYVLQQLKELFLDKSNWLDWPEATDDAGTVLDLMNPAAKKWNLLGASAKIANEKYGSPLADFIDCATREFLYDLADDNLIGKLIPYDDEYALICLGYEFLLKEGK